MKIFFALAFLAVASAVSLTDEEAVRVVEAPDQGFIPDDNLRIVNFVDAPEPDFAADVNLNQFMNEDGFHAIAPSELESIRLYNVPASAFESNIHLQDDGLEAIAPSELDSIRVHDVPQEDNIPYPYKPRDDPMWR